ncbi:hypothetical protein ACRYCC_15330 [Actinomadura scrupuli]|uniref:hypothetical protein n=1 Tax=Actinomadura scrupuli TaxID=559629 RepID=UPI003D993A59
MPPAELLITHEARLAPAWRRLGGVGRLLTGRLINVIAPNALVALKPFPVDVARDADGVAVPADFDRLMPGIRRAWAVLGFEGYGEDLMVLDTTLTTLPQALKTLTADLLP